MRRRKDTVALGRDRGRLPVSASWLLWLPDLAIAALLSALTYVAYRWVAGPSVLHQSSELHFVLLAEALLHGRLWLDPTQAARLGDITVFAGRYYVAFPPMPAILMLPFVAWRGPSFDDRLFSIALGSVNVGLTYLLARRLTWPRFSDLAVPIGRIEAVAVAVLLGFGTVAFYSALAGTVWFVAHIVALCFTLLYLLECTGACRPLVAGVLLAAAFLARAPAIFGLVFWAILALRCTRGFREALWLASRFAIPLVVAVVLLLAQNFVRFNSPFDFGYRSMRIASQLRPDLEQYGQFSSHFLPRNLAALLITAPLVSPTDLATWVGSADGPSVLLYRLTTLPEPGVPPFPVTFDPWGTGLWAVSPALAFGLRPPGRRYALAFAAGLAALVVAIPDLLYYNTGWYQYGYRFAADFIPFLLILVVLGLRRPLPPALRALFVLLLLISIASNLLGVRWFLHLPPYED
ncbi:MAG TPA: hypothetical protein VKX96_09385 [Chloroflexota bacterium]|nr:hypothetical protein [Chloroflexota bacterium]